MRAFITTSSSVVVSLLLCIIVLLLSSSSSNNAIITPAHAISSTLFGSTLERVRVEMVAPTETHAISEIRAAAETDPSKIVPIGLANGSRYQCHVPERVSTEESDKLWKEHLQKVRDYPLAPHLVSKLNTALSELCFTHPADWWSYKLCWGKNLKQFHADNTGKVEAEYFLGHGPKAKIEDGATDEFIFDVDPTNAMRARLVTEWFNGTECELSKKPRQLQLYLMCPDTSKSGDQQQHGAGSAAAMNRKPTMTSGGSGNPAESGELTIVEPSTCEYQVTLKHAAFCTVPELRTREQPETVVRCLDVTPAEESSSLSGRVPEIEGQPSASGDKKEQENEKEMEQEEPPTSSADIHVAKEESEIVRKRVTQPEDGDL